MSIPRFLMTAYTRVQSLELSIYVAPKIPSTIEAMSLAVVLPLGLSGMTKASSPSSLPRLSKA